MRTYIAWAALCWLAMIGASIMQEHEAAKERAELIATADQALDLAIEALWRESVCRVDLTNAVRALDMADQQHQACSCWVPDVEVER